MQIILLMLLSTYAFAQKNTPGIQCDPVETEKQCYNLLCNSVPSRAIPADIAQLRKAADSQAYKIDPKVMEDIQYASDMSEKIKNAARNSMTSENVKKVSAEIFSSPVEGINAITTLFAGDLKCVQRNGKCDLISSDLGQYSAEFKKLFAEFHDKTLVFNNNIDMTISDRKKYLEVAIDSLKGKLSNSEIKSAKKKVSKLKNDYDYIMFSMNTPWYSEYFDKIAEDFKSRAPVLEEALKVKIDELIKLDTSVATTQKRIQQSCNLASFVKSKLDEVDEKKFDESVLKVIESFKNKFLPKLSGESAKTLSQRINPMSFNLIPENSNFHPRRPLFGRHSNEYLPPKSDMEVVQDLGLIEAGLYHRCDVTGMLAKDMFSFGDESIFVSKYVLTQGIYDAITHEMGHWLSLQIKSNRLSKHSRNKLLAARECVSNFYPNEKRKSIYQDSHKGDHLRSEEDFADWFTAQAGLGENGLFCELQTMLKNYAGRDGDTYVPHGGDSHSNNLFREMTLRIHRNEVLPQSCKDLIELHPEAQPKKCDL